MLALSTGFCKQQCDKSLYLFESESKFQLVFSSPFPRMAVSSRLIVNIFCYQQLKAFKNAGVKPKYFGCEQLV